MALALNSAPVNYAAAYKPVLWSFVSDYSPQNVNAGEFNIAIIEIRPALQDDVDNYGVTLGDVLMEFTPTPNLLYAYQQITISNTDDTVFDGLYRVRSVINDGLVVLDADSLESDTGGVFQKTYERYTLIAEVKFSGITHPITGLPIPIQYEMKPDFNGIFTMDIQDAAQRGFRDILSNVDCRPGSNYDTVAPGENYITQTYTVRIFHGYMVTSDDGSFTYREITKGIQVTFPPRVVVNAVQPDNHTDIDETVDLTWQADLVGYQMSTSTTGGNAKRFLTYAPREGQKVGEDDDAFLAFLYTGTPGDPLSIVTGTYDDTNTLIAATYTPFDAPLNSGVIAIGPRNLGALITAETVKYRIGIANFSQFFVTEIFEFLVDRKCGEAYIRPQALNPLGGIDSIGLHIRELNGMTVERATTSKPNMEVTSNAFWTGDYNERVWAVAMARTYGANSAPMSAVMRKFFGENIFPSPDVRIPINDSRWTPIVITTQELPLYTSEEKPDRIRFDFILGTDNQRQRR